MSKDLYTSQFQAYGDLQDGQSESRVLVVLTGGTICMDQSENGFVPSPDFLNTHMRPRPSFNRPSSDHLPDLESFGADGIPRKTPTLRTPPSRHGRYVLYTVHELDPLLDSSSISAPGWTQMARVIQKNYPHYDGFVILHGTDSLAYTSSALSFMILNLQKPVVLTGSQVPMSSLHSDATDNLIGALSIAGHYLVPEVCLFFNTKLFRGCRATKVSADQFDAFASPNFGPLAEVKATGVQMYWERVRSKGTPRDNPGLKFAPLRIRAHLGTAYVACLRLFPGIKAELVDAVVRVQGLKGLVLQTFGAGNAPLGHDGIDGSSEQPPINGGTDGGLMRVLREAGERDNVVVGVSQCLTGSVSPMYASGVQLMRAGVIPGADLTTEAASTKLAFLFEGGEDEGGIEGHDGVETPRVLPEDVDWAARTERIRDGMRVNMRGEMTL